MTRRTRDSCPRLSKLVEDAAEEEEKENRVEPKRGELMILASFSSPSGKFNTAQGAPGGGVNAMAPEGDRYRFL